MSDQTPWGKAMVEAVAQTMCCRNGCEAKDRQYDPIHGQVAICQRDSCRKDATAAIRAVLERLKEPSEAMVKQSPYWQEMLDQALKELGDG